jgi:hypothetical protein
MYGDPWGPRVKSRGQGRTDRNRLRCVATMTSYVMDEAHVHAEAGAMTTTTSTLHVDDGITHPAVRPFLLTDAALTTGNGLVYLLAAGWLGDLFGAATSLLIGLGAFLVVVGAGVAWLATRRPVPRTMVSELAAFNAVWVVASLGYAVVGDLTTIGRVWDVLQALLVAAFAIGQAWFARRG